MLAPTSDNRTIYRFVDEYRFLSNFYPAVVWLDFMPFPSTEHAYQAAKTLDPDLRRIIAQAPTSGEAKKVGRTLVIRDDWEDIKVSVMEALLRQKFMGDLRPALYATKGQALVEGNWWHDQFWGDCYCDTHKDIPGENHLGKLLEQIRDEIVVVE